jgi:hypothetical protein
MTQCLMTQNGFYKLSKSATSFALLSCFEKPSGARAELSPLTISLVVLLKYTNRCLQKVSLRWAPCCVLELLTFLATRVLD